MQQPGQVHPCSSITFLKTPSPRHTWFSCHSLSPQCSLQNGINTVPQLPVTQARNVINKLLTSADSFSCGSPVNLHQAQLPLQSWHQSYLCQQKQIQCYLGARHWAPRGGKDFPMHVQGYAEQNGKLGTDAKIRAIKDTERDKLPEGHVGCASGTHKHSPGEYLGEPSGTGEDTMLLPAWKALKMQWGQADTKCPCLDGIRAITKVKKHLSAS